MREAMKNIEDLIDTFENTGDNGNFFIGDYSNIEIAIYLRKQKEEIERLNNIINELERYINEEYIYDELGMKIFDASKLQDKLQELKGVMKSENKGTI